MTTSLNTEATKLEQSNPIKLELDSPYAVLKVDREGSKFNNFVPDMIKHMSEAIDQVEGNREISVLIITGNNRVFSTGVDVNDEEIRHMDALQARYFSRTGKQIFSKLEGLEIPVIAAINGTALGGGLELALACDFRIASERAGFGLPESNLGIIPGWGGTQRLIRHVGYARALEMILTGEMIKASEALELGLIQKIVPKSEDTVEATKEWSSKFLNRSRVAIAICKKAVRMAADLPLKYGESMETELFGLAWASKHREMGIDSFIERKRPEFPPDF